MRFVRDVVIIVGVLAVIAIIYGTQLMRRGFGTQDEPSGVEKVVVRTVRNMLIPKSAREQVNPWKEESGDPDTQREGREFFADRCAMCHANDGSGQTRMGRNLFPRSPDMRLPSTQNLTDGELYYIIEKGIRLTGMPAWSNGDDTLQDDDAWKIVLFMRRLPKITPEELKDMEKYNPKGLIGSDSDQDTPGN
jgi:mono/diheme cytochrome c family protein